MFKISALFFNLTWESNNFDRLVRQLVLSPLLRDGFICSARLINSNQQNKGCSSNDNSTKFKLVTITSVTAISFFSHENIRCQQNSEKIKICLGLNLRDFLIWLSITIKPLRTICLWKQIENAISQLVFTNKKEFLNIIKSLF